MQIMIDTTHDRGFALLGAISALALLARSEAQEAGGTAPDMVDMMLESAIASPRRQAPRPVQTPTPPPIGRPAPVTPPPVPLPAGNEPVAPIIHPPVHPDAETFVPPGTQDDGPLEQGEPDLLPPQSVFGGALPEAQAPFAPAPTVADAPAAPSAPIVTGGGVVSAPVAALVASLANGEVDKQGFPWDARIHSETKKVNGDGTWRLRRNLDPGVKNAVVGELQAAIAARGGAAGAATFQPPATVPSPVPVPAPAAQVPVPSPSAVTVPVPAVAAPGSVPVPQPVTATVVPFPNQAATAPAVPVPAPAGVGVPNPGLPPVVSAFRELIQLVNVSLSKGTMRPEQLAEACAHVKVESITGLASQPILVPDIYQYMRERNWLTL